MDDVVTFGTPADVVRVAEGIDLECADVRGEKREVLSAGGEHVPWVEVDKGHEEVNAYGRACGDDQVGEDIVAKVEGCCWTFELDNDDIYGREDCVGHNYRIYD